MAEKVYPEWVQKHKAKGTSVRKVGNNYYLYKPFHSEKKREIDVQLQFLELFDRFREKNRNLLNEKINAIVIGLDKTTQLIHYNGK